MTRGYWLGAIVLLFAAGVAPAHAADESVAIGDSIFAFVSAVNHGDVASTIAHFADSPSISEDAPPFRWSGPGAGAAWMSAMGTNAQALGIAAIDMRIASATRVEVSDDRAYAIVPGVLTFTMKDGHSTHADGQLTFVLQRMDAVWKIETMTWTGPRDR